MRFMMLVKATQDSEAGVLPSREIIETMGRFNDELIRAGALLAADGLHPSSKGTRIRYAGKERTVTDGPFAETKELLAGYWVIQVKSRDEATQWALRVPFQEGEVELRQVFEPSDFPAEILPPEQAAREQAWREEMQHKAGAR
jgi:hypothetical protein